MRAGRLSYDRVSHVLCWGRRKRNTTPVLITGAKQVPARKTMHRNLNELPTAATEREEDAKRLLPYKEMTAEEYAAREGHRWLCFSFGECRYSDPDLNEWIHTLDDIFFTDGELQRTQERLLSPAELEQVRRESEEPF